MVGVCHILSLGKGRKKRKAAKRGEGGTILPTRFTGLRGRDGSFSAEKRPEEKEGDTCTLTSGEGGGKNRRGGKRGLIRGIPDYVSSTSAGQEGGTARLKKGNTQAEKGGERKTSIRQTPNQPASTGLKMSRASPTKGRENSGCS